MRRTLAWALATAALAAVAAVAAAGDHAQTAPSVAPYVEVSDGASAALAREVRGAGLRRAVVGFVVADRDRCAGRWDGAGPVAARPFAADIAALRRSGVTVALSFGGQQGVELARACRTPQALASAYAAAARAYGVKEVDFDIEGGALADRASIARRAAALRLLQSHHKAIAISLTLPVATHGLEPDALRVVRATLAAHVRISAVNVMALDFGDGDAPRPQGRMAAYVEQSARAARRQLAKLELQGRLALTVMIGRNDTPSEVVSLADARAIAAFARRTRIAELRYWSFNRDRSCPRPSTAASDDCSGIAQSPYAFARALAS